MRSYAKKSTKRSNKKDTKRSTKQSGKLKLVKIVKSPRAEKKFMAVFSDGSKTHFGAAGMSDYTKHKDSKRKERYMNRHKKRENWNNPKSPGALSRWVLWNKPSLKESISSYKRKFNL